jgi:hypothetical protein
MAEHFAKQEAQWEWERKERDAHNGSLDNIERLLMQQATVTQVSAGALQHMARITDAFIHWNGPETMVFMLVALPDYIPLLKRWRKRSTQDKGEGGSGEKGKEKEKEDRSGNPAGPSGEEGPSGSKEGEGGDKEGDGGQMDML